MKKDKYKLNFNRINLSLPQKSTLRTRVVIIGSGLAGISAAVTLAERGFSVELFEKNDYILGKVGAWNHKFDNGFETVIEHGYHGFFKQYYNLRNFLDKTGSSKFLIPLEDYFIKNSSGKNFSFKGVSPIPIINMFSLLKKNKLDLKKIFLNPRHKSLLKFLGYNKNTYFKKYDNTSLLSFAQKMKMDIELKDVFTTFGRAFFSKPEKVSLAELFRASHYYFTGNNKGILYDVMSDNYQESLIKPTLKYLKDLEIKLHLNYQVEKIIKKIDKFYIKEQEYDYLIIASEITGTKTLLHNFTSCDNDEKALKDLQYKLDNLPSAPPYAVLRIWIDKDIDKSNPFCIMPNNYKFLDLVAAYHRFDKSSIKWHKENNGYIFELHAYAIDDRLTEDEIQALMIKDFESIFPEIVGFKIIEKYFQLRNNFTAFETNCHKFRPENETLINNMFFAGDWVDSPLPAMLMEGAFTSGILAANHILTKEKLQEEQIFTVPLKGIFNTIIK